MRSSTIQPKQPSAPGHRVRVKSAKFQFCYTWKRGERLMGEVEGDRLHNVPNLVFNLRTLSALYIDATGCPRRQFDTVYGQFNLDFPGALFTGAAGAEPTPKAFFSLTYRGQEATLCDIHRGLWLSESWCPERWHIQELFRGQSVPLSMPSRPLQQIA